MEAPVDKLKRLIESSNDSKALKQALDQYSDATLQEVDEQTGASLLFYVVTKEPEDLAVSLLKYLIDERPLCDPSLQDRNLQTALFFAARDGKFECVKYLVQRGCPAGLQDSAGQTALYYSCRDGRDEVAAYLIKEGEVNVNSVDKVGQTVLFYAAREGRKSTVDLLLSLGADASVKDWQKKAAHSYAQRKGHNELAAFLKSVAGDQQPKLKRKSSHHAIVSEPRSKCHLQYRVCLPSGDIWLFAHTASILEFETEFPNLAAWSRIPPDSYKPTDAFRLEWAREGLQLVSLLANYPNGGHLFAKPVDVKLWNCPDYYTVIKEPRDLSTIKKKLKNLEYLSIQTFVRDIRLIFSNCYKYNSETSEVHGICKRVELFCDDVWAEKDIPSWIRKEEELCDWLEEHNLPVDIGMKAEAAKATQAHQEALIHEAKAEEKADSSKQPVQTDTNTHGSVPLQTVERPADTQSMKDAVYEQRDMHDGQSSMEGSNDMMPQQQLHVMGDQVVQSDDVPMNGDLPTFD